MEGSDPKGACAEGDRKRLSERLAGTFTRSAEGEKSLGAEGLRAGAAPRAPLAGAAIGAAAAQVGCSAACKHICMDCLRKPYCSVPYVQKGLADVAVINGYDCVWCGWGVLRAQRASAGASSVAGVCYAVIIPRGGF